jgi:hypothetical protein
MYFSTATLPQATGYSWMLPYSWTPIGSTNARDIAVNTGSVSGEMRVGVRVANACDGGASPAYHYVTIYSCANTIVPQPGDGPGMLENGFVSAEQNVSTGVEDFATAQKMTVYPNPATSEITIKTGKSLAWAEALLVNIVTGVQAYAQTLPQGNELAQLSVGHLPKGQYALIVKDKQGSIVETKHVVLQ